ncbi:MAG: translation elongation factor Ts [Phycisphaerales bacterium JB043]
MTAISAKDVMALRAKTGLGMMDCKKALAETSGDMEAAEDLLRKKLKGKMETRTERAAGEGRIQFSVASDNKKAAIVEIRAETDFTANNDEFVAASRKIADEALTLDAGDHEPTASMTETIDSVRISTGENASIARIRVMTSAGSIGSYLHHDAKTGVLFAYEGDIDAETVSGIAMHITAVVPSPKGVTSDDIPDEVIEKERKFALEQAIESGKNEEIAQKMVEGKVRKLYEELALIEQPFVKDPGTKVKDLLKGATISGFVRWQLGEDA